MRKENRGPPWGFGEQGKKDFYFGGTGEQRPNFEGNRGTKTILGNREHKKTNFRFLGNWGTSQFISGEQGNRNPLGGPQDRLYSLLSLFEYVFYSYDAFSLRPLNYFSWFLLAEAECMMSYPSIVEVDNKFCILEKQ